MTNNKSNDLDQIKAEIERIRKDRIELYNCVMFHAPLQCKGSINLEELDWEDCVSEEI